LRGGPALVLLNSAVLEDLEEIAARTAAATRELDQPRANGLAGAPSAA
jgi:hypothetical protein